MDVHQAYLFGKGRLQIDCISAKVFRGFVFLFVILKILSYIAEEFLEFW